jgi:hypothetical protein
MRKKRTSEKNKPKKEKARKGAHEKEQEKSK